MDLNHALKNRNFKDLKMLCCWWWWKVCQKSNTNSKEWNVSLLLVPKRKGNAVEAHKKGEKKRKCTWSVKEERKGKVSGKAAPIMSKIEISNIVCATLHTYISLWVLANSYFASSYRECGTRKHNFFLSKL